MGAIVVVSGTQGDETVDGVGGEEDAPELLAACSLLEAGSCSLPDQRRIMSDERQDCFHSSCLTELFSIGWTLYDLKRGPDTLLELMDIILTILQQPDDVLYRSNRSCKLPRLLLHKHRIQRSNGCCLSLSTLIWDLLVNSLLAKQLIRVGGGDDGREASYCSCSDEFPPTLAGSQLAHVAHCKAAEALNDERAIAAEFYQALRYLRLLYCLDVGLAVLQGKGEAQAESLQHQLILRLPQDTGKQWHYSSFPHYILLLVRRA
mmetsp:Transcript_3518/g.8607  ORF Transcript_3518/g.8607 Transcript_3518/m.8607 type:complete len:262 (+) Transcript_3518:2178-2963(+)